MNGRLKALDEKVCSPGFSPLVHRTRHARQHNNSTNLGRGGRMYFIIEKNPYSSSGVPPMIFFIFFLCALVSTIVLLFHVTVEINTLDKEVSAFTDEVKKHYEIG
jgi:hypothetical protein